MPIGFQTLKYGLRAVRALGVVPVVSIAWRKLARPGHYRRMQNFASIESYFRNGIGLEVGGPSSFFKQGGFMPIYDLLSRLDSVNFSESTLWSDASRDYIGFDDVLSKVGKQYILDAVDLSAVEFREYDFVLSCNNIEHIANPVRAVREWLAVTKVRGAVVIVAPRKESNFDHRREVVQFEHLLCDFTRNLSEDDLTHLPEILALHDIKRDPVARDMVKFESQARRNLDFRMLHHHVFDIAVLTQIFEYLGAKVVAMAELDTDYVVVGEKQ